MILFLTKWIMFEYWINPSSQPGHSGLQDSFWVLDQTNQIAENFKAIDYPQCFFIRSIKDIFENPNKIHETTSELSKFVAIEQEYKIPLSFLCLSWSFLVLNSGLPSWALCSNFTFRNQVITTNIRASINSFSSAHLNLHWLNLILIYFR